MQLTGSNRYSCSARRRATKRLHEKSGLVGYNPMFLSAAARDRSSSNWPHAAAYDRGILNRPGCSVICVVNGTETVVPVSICNCLICPANYGESTRALRITELVDSTSKLLYIHVTIILIIYTSGKTMACLDRGKPRGWSGLLVGSGHPGMCRTLHFTFSQYSHYVHVVTSRIPDCM